MSNVAWVEAYLHTKWRLDPSSRFDTIDMGQNLWGETLHGFLETGVGSPSNTMSAKSRPTFLPSGILIHRAIWPQQTLAENCGGGCAHLGRGT